MGLFLATLFQILEGFYRTIMYVSKLLILRTVENLLNKNLSEKRINKRNRYKHIFELLPPFQIISHCGFIYATSHTS
jgi:hypothetical protein